MKKEEEQSKKLLKI